MTQVNAQLPKSSFSYQGVMAPGIEAALLTIVFIMNLIGGDQLKLGALQTYLQGAAGRSQADSTRKAGENDAIATLTKSIGELASGAVAFGASAYGMVGSSSITGEGEDELKATKENLKTVNESLDKGNFALNDLSDETELADDRRLKTLTENEDFTKPFSASDREAVEKGSPEKLKTLQETMESYIKESEPKVNASKSNQFKGKIEPRMNALSAVAKGIEATGGIASAPFQSIAASKRAHAQMSETTKGIAANMAGSETQKASSEYQDATQIINSLVAMVDTNVSKE